MKKILDVPYRKQKFANSCFPAAVRMVLGFYGDSINEKILYKGSIIGGHKGTWDVKIAQFLLKKGYDVTSYWNGRIEGWNIDKSIVKVYKREYRKALKLGMQHKKNATVSLIKSLIGEGIPVLTEVFADRFYGKKLGYTHMVVVIGYDRNNFYVHDPDKNIGGKLRKIPISRFRKSWEKLRESGRSMFVIKQR